MPRSNKAPVTHIRITDQPTERADAARNRQVLLVTATEILATDGLDGLTMDRLAKEAGVGVGTVYRRFGDQAGLVNALMDQRERDFQADFLSGPPPLGPGAPAADRIRAFLHAYLDRLEVEHDLRLWGESKSPTGGYRVGAYQAARAHLRSLLRSAGVTVETDYLADALLSLIRAALFVHLRQDQGMSLEQMKAGTDALLDGILCSAGD